MKQTLFLSFVTVFSLFHPQNLQAATSYQVNFGATVKINEFGVCYDVTNNHASGLALFVPTNSAAEWAAFYGATTPGVTKGECCATGTYTYTAGQSGTLTLATGCSSVVIEAIGGGGSAGAESGGGTGKAGGGGNAGYITYTMASGAGGMSFSYNVAQGGQGAAGGTGGTDGTASNGGSSAATATTGTTGGGSRTPGSAVAGYNGNGTGGSGSAGASGGGSGGTVSNGATTIRGGGGGGASVISWSGGLIVAGGGGGGGGKVLNGSNNASTGGSACTGTQTTTASTRSAPGGNATANGASGNASLGGGGAGGGCIAPLAATIATIPTAGYTCATVSLGCPGVGTNNVATPPSGGGGQIKFTVN